MSFEKIVTRFGILGNILMGLGGILSSIHSTREMMSPALAYYGTAFVILSLIGLTGWMQFKKPIWEGKPITYPNFLILAMAAGLVFFMWVPVFWQSGKTSDAKDTSDKPQQTEEGTRKNVKPVFPAKFDSTKLYILVTRFEADESTKETECYGHSIVSRIEGVSEERHLPIIPYYLNSESPFQRDSAEAIRSYHNADLIVWGKIDDADANCTAGGFCMKFIPSDTLLYYTGRRIKQQTKDTYQDSISNRMIEEGLIKMGEEIFDDWLVDMSNLKIGKKKPALFHIDPNWSTEKRHVAYLTRGSIWYSLKDYEKAFEDFKMGISIKETDATTYMQLVDCKVFLGELDSALSYANLMVNKFPGHVLAYNSRANVKAGMKRFEEAIFDLDTAISLSPEFALCYESRAMLNSQIGRHEEAIADFDTLLMYQAGNPNLYCRIGQSKYILNRYEDAIRDFDKAIQFNHRTPHIHYYRGSCYNKLKRFKEALNDFNYALKSSPNFSAAYAGRGFAFTELSRYEEAIKDYSQAIRTEPRNAVFYNNRGGAKLKMGLKKEAILDFEMAVSLTNNMEPTFVYQLEGAKRSNIKPPQVFWEKYKHYWPALLLVFFTYFVIKYRKIAVPQVKTSKTKKSKRNRGKLHKKN